MKIMISEELFMKPKSLSIIWFKFKKMLGYKERFYPMDKVIHHKDYVTMCNFHNIYINN